MTKQIVKNFTILLILQTIVTFGQKEFSTDNLVGKWVVCSKDKLLKDYKCEDNSDYVYEYLSDGTYKDYSHKGASCYEVKIEFVTGTWTLNNNILTRNEDKWCLRSKPTVIAMKINWLNKDVFYIVTKPEGRRRSKVYLYYTRKD